MKKYIHIILPLLCAFLQSMQIRIVAPGVSKSDVVDAEWCLAKNGCTIWGTATTHDLFIVETYDKELKTIGAYKKSLPGFYIEETRLVYQDEKCLEFLLTDKKRNRSAFIRLNHKLQELYFSGQFLRSQPVERDSTVLHLDYNIASNAKAYLRKDSAYWEVILIKSQDDNNTRRLAIQQLSQKGDDKLPVFGFDWRYDLNEVTAEHIKFLHADSINVYLYANYSTLKGEQYLYCLNVSDGSLKYRTKLTAEGVRACIYSNCLFEPAGGSLILGGTSLRSTNDSVGDPGIFLMRIDERGNIISSVQTRGTTFFYPPSGVFNGTTSGIPPRNRDPYSKFCEIDLLPEGELVSFIDNYSVIITHRGTVNSVQDMDDKYHYLMTQSIQYKFSGKQLMPISNSNEYPESRYQAGVIFSGITNYVAQQTHLEDIGYVNDINKIVDADVGSEYYVGYAYDAKAHLIKCLLKNVFKSNIGSTELYFKALAGRKNFVAFQKPEPIKGQDVTVKNRYLIRDYNTLYKLTTTSNSYMIDTCGW